MGFFLQRQSTNFLKTHRRDAVITDEGIQILSYTRHSMQLRIEVSLACHTYFDTGHPYMHVMVIFEDLRHYNMKGRDYIEKQTSGPLALAVT